MINLKKNNNMQPYLDWFASFLVFNENFGFKQNMNKNLWSQINGIILG